MVTTEYSTGASQVERMIWRLAGLWPTTARQRLWLPETFQISGSPAVPLGMCTIVRNEQAYIEEWFEFHCMMGVERFFIYDNGSTDETIARLQKSPHAHRLTIIDWANFLSGWEGVTGTSGRMQRLAMLHCVANFGQAVEWLAFIDVDEFLYPATKRNLLEVLADFADLESLSVYWRMFGTSGHKKRLDGLVTENYTFRSSTVSGPEKNLCRVKTIVRPRAVRGVHNTHTLILQGGYPESWTEERVRIGYADHRPETFSDDIIKLNHYYSKSQAEYHLRRQVPAESSRKDFRGNDRLLNLVEQDPVEDLAIQRFVPELKRRLGKGHVPRHGMKAG